MSLEISDLQINNATKFISSANKGDLLALLMETFSYFLTTFNLNISFIDH